MYKDENSAFSMFITEVDQMDEGTEFHFSDLESTKGLMYRSRYAYVYGMYRCGGPVDKIGNGFFRKI